MKRFPGVVLALAATLAAQAGPKQEDLAVGKSALKVELAGVALDVFAYRPEGWDGTRMLVVLHGVLRNADEYRDHAATMGDRFGMLVVAPRFDAERFPSRAYQRGGILREDGSAAPPHEWTYARIPELAAAIRVRTARPQLKHWILGHSAGGQFVLRMSAFQDTGAERLVAANPGSVLMPDLEAEFGYGFGGLPKELAGEERLRKYLAAPLTLYLGTGDDHPDEYFDESAEAMVAGGGRHQRNLALYWTGKTLAKERGWPFGWRLVEAVGVVHDHEAMFAHAQCEVALFGERITDRPGEVEQAKDTKTPPARRRQ
ncbi:MAG: hypothetical protein RL398_2693 [Planctomycetota bacterium]|jgi:dienelactone hydrolase